MPTLPCALNQEFKGLDVVVLPIFSEAEQENYTETAKASIALNQANHAEPKLIVCPYYATPSDKEDEKVSIIIITKNDNGSVTKVQLGNGAGFETAYAAAKALFQKHFEDDTLFNNEEIKKHALEIGKIPAADSIAESAIKLFEAKTPNALDIIASIATAFSIQAQALLQESKELRSAKSTLSLGIKEKEEEIEGLKQDKIDIRANAKTAITRQKEAEEKFNRLRRDELELKQKIHNLEIANAELNAKLSSRPISRSQQNITKRLGEVRTRSVNRRTPGQTLTAEKIRADRATQQNLQTHTESPDSPKISLKRNLFSDSGSVAANNLRSTKTNTEEASPPATPPRKEEEKKYLNVNSDILTELLNAIIDTLPFMQYLVVYTKDTILDEPTKRNFKRMETILLELNQIFAEIKNQTGSKDDDTFSLRMITTNQLTERLKKLIEINKESMDRIASMPDLDHFGAQISKLDNLIEEYTNKDETEKTKEDYTKAFDIARTTLTELRHHMLHYTKEFMMATPERRQIEISFFMSHYNEKWRNVMPTQATTAEQLKKGDFEERRNAIDQQPKMTLLNAAIIDGLKKQLPRSLFSQLNEACSVAEKTLPELDRPDQNSQLREIIKKIMAYASTIQKILNSTRENLQSSNITTLIEETLKYKSSDRDQLMQGAFEKQTITDTLAKQLSDKQKELEKIKQERQNLEEELSRQAEQTESEAMRDQHQSPIMQATKETESYLIINKQEAQLLEQIKELQDNINKNEAEADNLRTQASKLPRTYVTDNSDPLTDFLECLLHMEANTFETYQCPMTSQMTSQFYHDSLDNITKLKTHLGISSYQLTQDDMTQIGLSLDDYTKQCSAIQPAITWAKNTLDRHLAKQQEAERLSADEAAKAAYLNLGMPRNH